MAASLCAPLGGAARDAAADKLNFKSRPEPLSRARAPARSIGLGAAVPWRCRPALRGPGGTCTASPRLLAYEYDSDSVCMCDNLFIVGARSSAPRAPRVLLTPQVARGVARRGGGARSAVWEQNR